MAPPPPQGTGGGAPVPRMEPRPGIPGEFLDVVIEDPASGTKYDLLSLDALAEVGFNLFVAARYQMLVPHQQLQ